MVEILPMRNTDGGVALDTLAKTIAMSIESSQGSGLLQSFLMKKVAVDANLITPDSGDTIIIGMARGDATVTEIKAAVEQIQLERDLVDQANARQVLWETVRVLSDEGGFPKTVRIVESLGGGKGIPFEDGDGWQWFAYNAGGNDQVAGAFVHLSGVYYGVWL